MPLRGIEYKRSLLVDKMVYFPDPPPHWQKTAAKDDEKTEQDKSLLPGSSRDASDDHGQMFANGISGIIKKQVEPLMQKIEDQKKELESLKQKIKEHEDKDEKKMLSMDTAIEENTNKIVANTSKIEELEKTVVTIADLSQKLEEIQTTIVSINEKHTALDEKANLSIEKQKELIQILIDHYTSQSQHITTELQQLNGQTRGTPTSKFFV